MTKIKLLLACGLLVACAKGPDQEAAKAEENFKQAENITRAASCDGQGDTLSGTYTIEAESGTAKCSDNDESGEILGVGFAIICVQKESLFQCKTDGDKLAIDGCVNKNGSFSISSKTDLNTFEKLIGTSGASKTEKMTLIEANIQEDQGTGTIKYASVSSNSKQKKGCNLSWNIELKKIEESEK